MTSPPPGAPAFLPPPRTLAAMGLLGYVALAEFFAFLVWLAGQSSFTGRSNDAAGMFLNLFTMAMPILAVLIATRVSPVLPMARLLVTVALIEYAVSIGLGVITFLIGIGHYFDFNSGVEGTRDLILTLGAMVLIAIAGYITYGIFTEMGGRITGPRATYGNYPTQPVPPGGGTTYAPGSAPAYPPPPAGPTYPPPPAAGPTYPPPGPPQYPGGQ